MSIKEIIQFVKTKKSLALWIAAIIIVSILLIWTLLSGREEGGNNSDKILYDTPLLAEKSYSVVIDKGIYEDKKLPTKLEVLGIKDLNYNSRINNLLLSLGKGGLKKDNVEDDYYTWSNSSDTVEYIPEYQSLSIKFTESVTLNINTQINSTDSGKEVLKYIYSNYLDKSYDFKNVKVTQEGKKYRIEANRVVNGYPLYLADNQGYTDYIVVDDSSNLYEAKLTLVEFESNGNESIKLVHPSNLSQILKDANYPKEIFQGYNPQIAEDIIKSNIKPPEELDYVNGEYDLPLASLATAKSVEVVYYYSGNTYKQISPTYRIVGEGEILFNGKKYMVPVIVFANALDPERVYVPE